jgi:hypothetical protein
MDGTIIQQGNFISTGKSTFIPIRSSADWFKTYNYSVIGTAPAAPVGYQFYWQRGMLPGTGFEWRNITNLNTQSLSKMTTGGFTWVDSTTNVVGPAADITSITWGATGLAVPYNNLNVVVTPADHGLVDGDIVRIIEPTGAEQIGGYEYEVILLAPAAARTFALKYAPELAVAAVPAKYRKITYGPSFAPATASIMTVSKAANAVVTFAKPHGYNVGDQIRFSITSTFGMPELDGLTGNVLTVGTLEGLVNPTTAMLTVDIDTTAFTTFEFPAVADFPFTPSITVPMGEGLYTPPPPVLPHNLLDATHNVAEMGMSLGAGIHGPAGVDTNVIYWVAGKSFNI